MTTSPNAIFKFDPGTKLPLGGYTTPRFYEVPGKARDIRIGANGRIFAVGLDDRIVEWIGDREFCQGSACWTPRR